MFRKILNLFSFLKKVLGGKKTVEIVQPSIHDSRYNAAVDKDPR